MSWNRLLAGETRLFKGDSTAKSAENSQFQFSQMLQSIFAQQFGAQRGVLDYLNGKLQAIVNNPQGFSPEALAAAKTGAIQQTAADYANASRAVNNQIAARGGSTLPSGVNAQIQGQLAQGAANEESSNLNQITLANEQQKQQNYWNAINGLNGVAAGYNPTGYSGQAIEGGNVVAGLSNAYKNSQKGFWSSLAGGLGQGLGQGLGAFATGGLSMETGWGFDPNQSS